MSRPCITPMPEFLMDIRRKLWLRLAELASIEISSEVEKSETERLAQEFWDWQPVEYKLRPDIKRSPWNGQDTHPVQQRIMWAVYTNSYIAPSDQFPV